MIYKAVRRKGTLLTSLAVWGQATMTYEKNVVSRAPGWLADAGYGPTAFEDLNEAFIAAVRMRGALFEIWECEGVGRLIGKYNDPLPCFCALGFLARGQIHRYWVDDDMSGWPPSTVMYEGIRLIAPVVRILNKRGSVFEMAITKRDDITFESWEGCVRSPVIVTQSLPSLE